MRYKFETGTNVLSIEFSMYGYPTSRTMRKYTSPYIQGQNHLAVMLNSPDRFTKRNSYSREEHSPISDIRCSTLCKISSWIRWYLESCFSWMNIAQDMREWPCYTKRSDKTGRNSPGPLYDLTTATENWLLVIPDCKMHISSFPFLYFLISPSNFLFLRSSF